MSRRLTDEQPQIIAMRLRERCCMTPDELRTRTKQFALRIMHLVGALPHSVEGLVIANQLMKSGTSMAANDRAACRGRSRAEFVAKLGNVVEEADEAVFWLQLVVEGNVRKRSRVEGLMTEANELLAIMVASRTTAKK